MLSFGTEDRLVEKFVPPNDKVYNFIKFRGSDIRDLHVHKAETAPVLPTPPPPKPAPKPVPALKPPVDTSDEITFGYGLDSPSPSTYLPPPPAPSAAKAAHAFGHNPPPVVNRNAAALAPTHRAPASAAPGSGRAPGGGGSALPGMGASLANRRLRGGHGAVDDVTPEFDFMGNNLEFDKEAEKAKVAESGLIEVRKLEN